MAVGAFLWNQGGEAVGRIDILFLADDWTVKESAQIYGGNFGQCFGLGLTSPGDINGDGYQDLVAGCSTTDGGRGSVEVLMLGRDGQVIDRVRIGQGTGGFPVNIRLNARLDNVSALGDLDLDGVPDISVAGGFGSSFRSLLKKSE